MYKLTLTEKDLHLLMEAVQTAKQLSRLVHLNDKTISNAEESFEVLYEMLDNAEEVGNSEESFEVLCEMLDNAEEVGNSVFISITQSSRP